LALECMQCDKNAAWYSEEEHERHIEMCQNGLVPPTPCRNRSHTHCIVSWYRSGGSKERVVTERKCGGVEDVTGCTLYNSKISRKHIYRNQPSSTLEFRQIFVIELDPNTIPLNLTAMSFVHRLENPLCCAIAELSTPTNYCGRSSLENPLYAIPELSAPTNYCGRSKRLRLREKGRKKVCSSSITWKEIWHLAACDL
ncbi:hypothetical protein TELCIR_08811, partial [Teladorsagia circumcincta]